MTNQPLSVLCKLYSHALNEYMRKKDDLEFARSNFNDAAQELNRLEKLLSEKVE